ncbi:aspartate aminotransferase family protein [Desulfosarcina widdelii]|uniref:Aspartate aminotransferase family protein n=1 Tax=Desulfosarcina widdelii TaxID=947919 RepID=A0A5K7Z6U3_9BACT|nr:aspartate aminotransferase family protein [Desulfosarcina widdelii]BBO77526.1 aspartate aminotransferase family protein [Desulfosarcina widdelii]
MDCLFRYPGYELPLRDIVRAENCCLYDADGNRYVDLESGVWCTAIGHGHPRVLKLMNEQAGRIAHTGFSYTSRIVDDAAHTILALHSFENGKCVFLSSGSEAVEYGVRLAQAINRRPTMLTMADSYFGAYGAASVRPAETWFCFDWMACENCASGGDCSDSCERWAAIPFDRIGGFLFEPGSSSGLVRFPPEKLIRSIAAAITALDGLIMVNEVTTGVGRTGKWFGYQHYGIQPDIVAMGKGIGNGYPVSVTAVSRQASERVASSDFKYAQSHQNDPLGAAIALEVVRTIGEEDLVERGKEMGAILFDGLQTIQARTNSIRSIRGRGLMQAVDLEDNDNFDVTREVQQELVRKGYILARRPGVNTLRIDPSLTIEKSDIENFLAVLEKLLVKF